MLPPPTPNPSPQPAFLTSVALKQEQLPESSVSGTEADPFEPGWMDVLLKTYPHFFSMKTHWGVKGWQYNDFCDYERYSIGYVAYAFQFTGAEDEEVGLNAHIPKKIVVVVAARVDNFYPENPEEIWRDTYVEKEIWIARP